MSLTAEIRERLAASFAAQTLEVIDESEQHIGHAGYKDGGESHFRVKMTTPELAPLSRIARHRAIHNALGADIIARIHALALEVSG